MNLLNLFESDFNKKPQQGVVEGGPYDLPGIDYDRPGDTPSKRRSAPSDYPYSQEQDDAYFNDIFRKKREAAKKAAQDKEQGVAEGQEVDVNVVVEKLQQIAAHAKRQIQNADYDQQKRYATIVRDRALAALDMVNQGGNTPEAAHAAFAYMQTGKQGMAESRMSDLDAEYEDYKRLSPREFYNMYKTTKQQWLAKYKSMLPQQSMEEDVKLPYPVRSEKLGRANMELLIRAYNQPTGPRTTLSFGDRILELDRDDIEAVAQYYDNVLKNDDARWNFISGVMSDPDGLTNVLIKLGRRKTQNARQPGLFQEADKKKDDEDLGTQVRDVALQRAISRAKADFPAAGSGMEALAKDFMRGQEQDQKSFDQIRQAERQQDRMLAKINQIDQEQAQEIQGLEKQNSGLAQRLQQLQSVNSQLEKKLAAMSGRKTASAQSKADKPSGSKPQNPTDLEPGAPTPIGTPAPDKSAAKSSQPALPVSTGPSAMSSMTKQLTTQNPEVLEPITSRGAAPRFKTAGAQDVVPRTPSQVSSQAVSDITKGRMADMMNSAPGYASADTDELRNLVGQEVKATAENKEQKPERPEADYGDEYQAMVKRVGQKAKEGPRKTVWDPVKRVYKTVPVNK